MSNWNDVVFCLSQALFSLFIAPDAKNILKPSASFEGMAGKFVVSPIVYEIVFQFYRSEVRTWAEDVGRWRDARRVISAHFPICEANNNMIGNPFNRGASPVARFVRAFDWAKSTDAAPVDFRGGRTLPGAGATRADPKGCASVGWKRMVSLF